METQTSKLTRFTSNTNESRFSDHSACRHKYQAQLLAAPF